MLVLQRVEPGPVTGRGAPSKQSRRGQDPGSGTDAQDVRALPGLLHDPGPQRGLLRPVRSGHRGDDDNVRWRRDTGRTVGERVRRDDCGSPVDRCGGPARRDRVHREPRGVGEHLVRGHGVAADRPRRAENHGDDDGSTRGRTVRGKVRDGAPGRRMVLRAGHARSHDGEAGQDQDCGDDRGGGDESAPCASGHGRTSVPVSEGRGGRRSLTVVGTTDARPGHSAGIRGSRRASRSAQLTSRPG